MPVVVISEDNWRKFRKGAIIRCPQCEREAPLDHTIHADGTVEPSVECPFEGCSFHEHVVLENWFDR